MSCWENDFNCGCLASRISLLVCNLFRGTFHPISLRSVLQFCFSVSLSYKHALTYTLHIIRFVNQRNPSMPFSRLASRCRSIVWQRLISQRVCALYKQQMQNYGHMMLSLAPKHTHKHFLFFLREIACLNFVVCSQTNIYFRLNQCVNFIQPHLPYWWSYELISILFAFIIWYNTFCGLSWYVQLMFYDVICTKLNQLHAVITVHVHLQQLFGGLSMKGHSANNLVISAHGKD